MTTYAMMIDIERCNGCYNCFIACKDEHCGNDYAPIAAPQPEAGHYWMNIKEIERGQYPQVKVAYIPIPCMQCEDAPCVAAALDGAVYRRPDGIVVIDPVKAKGQRQIAAACPYRVIYWNEALALPQKCTFCAHLLDRGWKEPRCVQSCPADAIVFGDLDDASSEIARLKKAVDAERLKPDFQGEPKVWYRYLPKRFIAGEVVLADKKTECAQNVDVTLQQAGSVIARTVTNVYGDFEFEGLADDGEYDLLIAHPGYVTRNLPVRTRIDVSLGVVELTPG
jgi:Fe-S-cluster-containing dehydrogenase component